MPKPLVTGAHAILYSLDADRDRAFFREALALPSVDAGEGWLIFALPPAEVAVHPGGENGRHELYLLTKDVAAFVAAMNDRGLACSEPRALAWGTITYLTLPGGGKLGVYEPHHPQPKPARARRPTARTSARSTRKGTPRRR
jgi:hypothetical protein